MKFMKRILKIIDYSVNRKVVYSQRMHYFKTLNAKKVKIFIINSSFKNFTGVCEIVLDWFHL